MTKKFNKFFLILTMLCLVLTLASCNETVKSSTGIYGLNIEDLSDESFYTGITTGEFELDIKSTSEFKISDINLVISDPSIADITYEIEESFFLSDIAFKVTGLNVGTTTFYFETNDQIIQSETVEINVQYNIKSIQFSDSSELIFSEWMSDEERYFSIETYESLSDVENELEFISEDPEIAIIEYDEESWLFDSCIITPVNVGETYVYIQTKDKSIQSEKIKVIVEEEKVDTEDGMETELEAEENSEISADDVNIDNSRTVYVTPYGEKYHYSKSCAGKNAIETTENSAKRLHDPCKKCAQ